jgi:hypothetical protein
MPNSVNGSERRLCDEFEKRAPITSSPYGRSVPVVIITISRGRLIKYIETRIRFG